MTIFGTKRIVEGCKLPTPGPITENELAWVEFLRIVYHDAVPVPTFDQVVRLRQMGQVAVSEKNVIVDCWSCVPRMPYAHRQADIDLARS
jgi:hypothetical protein